MNANSQINSISNHTRPYSTVLDGASSLLRIHCIVPSFFSYIISYCSFYCCACTLVLHSLLVDLYFLHTRVECSGLVYIPSRTLARLVLHHILLLSRLTQTLLSYFLLLQTILYPAVPRIPTRICLFLPPSTASSGVNPPKPANRLATIGPPPHRPDPHPSLHNR